MIKIIKKKGLYKKGLRYKKIRNDHYLNAIIKHHKNDYDKQISKDEIIQFINKFGDKSYDLFLKQFQK